MKKFTPRALALLLTLSMLLVGLTGFSVSSAALSDIAGKPCEEAVTEMVALRLISGYPDGTFQPDRSLSRVETAKILANAMLLDPSERADFSVTGGHWGAPEIRACAEAGVIQGFPDGSFQPETTVTYEQLAVLCLRAVGYSDLTMAQAFEKAVELNLISKDAQVGAPANRGDAAVAIYGATKLPTGTTQNGAFYANTLGATLLAGRKAWVALEGSVLRPFTLVGYWDGKTVNASAISAGCIAYVWDKDLNAFYEKVADSNTVLYNYAAVCDTVGDTVGDTLVVIPRSMSADYWNAGATFSDPRASSNTAYRNTYNNAYNIPYGERLISHTDANGYFSFSSGAMDYYNIVASGDLANSTYWPIYDWYNTTSTDTLTVLTHFKTIQQSTGWACGMTSALMAMEWYDLRGDLNELDLSALRNKKNDSGATVWGGYTDTRMLVDSFTALNTMQGSAVWAWESTYDYVDADGTLSGDYLSPGWIQDNLAKGRPILVGWNSFGGHWQVIIGYDNMGTETDADDVLILADPYDTTDHRNDGVNLQSYQRFFYDRTQNFDRDFSRDDGYGVPVMFMPYPASGYNYTKTAGSGLAVKSGARWARNGNRDNNMLIPFGNTATDLANSVYERAKAQRGTNGLAGPASTSYYRTFDRAGTPYYASFDFYSGKSSDISASLTLLEGFKTAQQASEWSCGPASARMVLNWFGKMGTETEFSLSKMRKNDREGATTLDGMMEIFDALNAKGGDWKYLSTDDLDDDLQIGDYSLEEDLIAHCLENGIPVLIGWDEWGGHWQVVIGYDDMGTEATQDDVLILADPYDTTDHNQDGYVIESFERLVYGWGSRFDERGEYVFLIAAPTADMAKAGLVVSGS